MNSITIRDLIDQLESLAHEYGDETEVRLATQPSWPFEHAVGRVEAVELCEDRESDEDEALDDETCSVVVYIGEGSQLGYLAGDAAQALGWK